MSEWQPIETAPRDGTVIIALAKFKTARAGCPQFVRFMENEWRGLGRMLGEPLDVWGWLPRDILPEWTSKPNITGEK